MSSIVLVCDNDACRRRANALTLCGKLNMMQAALFDSPEAIMYETRRCCSARSTCTNTYGPWLPICSLLPLTSLFRLVHSTIEFLRIRFSVFNWSGLDTQPNFVRHAYTHFDVLVFR